VILRELAELKNLRNAKITEACAALVSAVDVFCTMNCFILWQEMILAFRYSI
jgi:hypothetical protein